MAQVDISALCIYRVLSLKQLSNNSYCIDLINMLIVNKVGAGRRIASLATLAPAPPAKWGIMLEGEKPY